MRALFLITACLASPLLRADSLTLGSANGTAGTSIKWPLSFTNTHQIVGMQFDLEFPPAITNAGAATASSATTNHAAESREIAPGIRRIVLYSASNQLLPSDLVLEVPLELKQASPAGGPTVTVSNIILTDKLGQTFTPTINRPALDLWRLANFTESERQDPNIIGDNSDPDKDGYANIMEFLFSTNPLAKDDASTATQNLVQTTIVGPDGRPAAGPMSFSFDYPKAKGAVGVKLWVESSTNLTIWKQEAVEPVNRGAINSVTDRMRLVVESDPGTAPKKFFRVGAVRSSEVVLKVPFGEWIARYFSGSTALPSNTGTQSDPDGDGIVNLMEYYFGSDPKKFSREALPFPRLRADGNQKTAYLTYDRAKEAQGVALKIQGSEDLLIWTPRTFTEAATGEETDTKIQFSADINGNAPDRQFFRFEIQENP